MNSNGFFIPGYMPNNMMSINPMMRLTGNVLKNPITRAANIGSISRGSGFFNKITGGIRSFNWGALLNNANKTLNVVNQAIPLVRQAGPMVNNMKNMVKIAKVFGNETTNKKGYKHLNTTTIDNTSINIQNDKNITANSNIYNYDAFNQKKEIENGNSPNFFV